MSEPVKKTIKVLEYLAALDGAETSAAAIATECDIPSATANRIISTLEESGFIRRKGRGCLIGNFVFEKRNPFSEDYLSAIRAEINYIVQQTQQSAEILRVEREELYWVEKIEHPNLAIKLRATVGFRRDLYELDAPSRAFLNRLKWSDVRDKYNTKAFVSTGGVKNLLNESDAKGIIESSENADVAFDLEGNNLGIRRFAKLFVCPENGEQYLICIAEAALHKKDFDSHINKNTELLQQAAANLEGWGVS